MSPSVTSCRTIGDDDYDEKRRGVSSLPPSLSLESGVLKVARQERAMSCQFPDASALAFFLSLSLFPSPALLRPTAPRRGYSFSHLLPVAIHLAVLFICRRLFVRFSCNRVRILISLATCRAAMNFSRGARHVGKPPRSIRASIRARLPGSIN